ncbi:MULTISPECIES: cyclase family protein [Haloarcula]|uniref:cyclase family protein n=1 Tax=Haloarcula TaxID=2237 RepID=UPI0023EC8E69|nr:cyclase family protein [Halomicroarcula sp. XH51]
MSEWIDLTQTLAEDSPTLPPLHPKPEFEDYATLEEDDYNSTLLHLETHCGTHMDAPTHFLSKDEYRTIEEITVDEMVTEGVVCDFTDKAPGEGIGRDELAAQCEAHDLQAGDYLILDCGMAPADTETYLKNFVYPEESAAEYMVERDIACVAIDALSADKPGATLEEHHVHYTLLPEDILIVEGVANLEGVSPGRYDVICTPIPYANRDGSQVRLLVRPQ